MTEDVTQTCFRSGDALRVVQVNEKEIPFLSHLTPVLTKMPRFSSDLQTNKSMLPGDKERQLKWL